MKSYAAEFFRLDYPAGWSLRETDGALSLWKSERGGAITLSTLLGDRDADALERCARFAEAQGLDHPRVSGDASSADAAFDLPDGGWCRARILARGPRLLFATYITREPDAAEEDEVERIFASLRLG